VGAGDDFLQLHRPIEMPIQARADLAAAQSGETLDARVRPRGGYEMIVHLDEDRRLADTDGAGQHQHRDNIRCGGARGHEARCTQASPM
jgi:hypothetical protein